MKYIVNILLFLIMIYSLTVMPIDMKALQVDVSWEKYKAIEEKKANEEQQAAIEETVKESAYSLDYSGETYLFNPNQIELTLSGDEKLPDLISDVVSKMTFEWQNVNSGDAQILSVPPEAVSTGPISGTTETSAKLTVSLTSLTNIPDGQYLLKIRSQSELTAASPSTDLDVSWFKKSSYNPYTGTGFGKLAVVTYYYPTADGSNLIPITESAVNSKILRKIANKLYSGQTENTSLKTGPLAPRIRNIQLKGGTLSLFITSADLEASKANGLTITQTVSLISKTFFSLPYIEEIQFYLDNKPISASLYPADLPAPLLRTSEAASLYHLTSLGSQLYFYPTDRTFTTPADVLSAMTSPDSSQNGKLTIRAIPANVKAAALTDPADPKKVTVDLSITGSLYGGDPKLTRMMLDAISLNLVRSGLATEVYFTVGGQPGQTLNEIPLTEAYPAPLYLNVKTNN